METQNFHGFCCKQKSKLEKSKERKFLRNKLRHEKIDQLVISKMQKIIQNGYFCN